MHSDYLAAMVCLNLISLYKKNKKKIILNKIKNKLSGFTLADQIISQSKFFIGLFFFNSDQSKSQIN